MAALQVSKNQIKYLQSLKLKKYRQKYDSFIVEGRKVAAEALKDKSLKIKALYAVDEWVLNSGNSDHLQNIPVYALSDQILTKVSSLVTPDQVLVECAIASPNLPNADSQLVLFLDGISDPGNLGTIIRSADWFGISHLILAPGTADCYNPKCVQASMGSIIRMSIAYCSFQSLTILLPSHKIFVATMDGISATKVKVEGPTILVIGSESHGVSDAVLKHPHHKISIPRATSSQADSLNAAMATTALLSLLTLDRSLSF